MSELLLNEEANRDINELFLSQLSSGIFLFCFVSYLCSEFQRAALSPSCFLGARGLRCTGCTRSWAESKHTKVERGMCVLVCAHVSTCR